MLRRLAVMLAGVLVVSHAARALTTSAPPQPASVPATAWRAAVSETPAPRPTADGVSLPCPFAKANQDRFYWDQTVPGHFFDRGGIELDITVHRPEALRAFSVYLESGGGWYVGVCSFQRPGRQRISLSRMSFATEGKPNGWDHIRRVRLSAWRGQGCDTEVVLHSLVSRVHPVRIIVGTQSCPPAERRIARDVSVRIAEWLGRLNIPTTMLTEEEAAAGGLTGAQVVLLGYNTELPDKTRKAVQTFLDQGGHAIVCYSSDEQLAAIMGMKLGAWSKAEKPLQWCSFSFSDAKSRHLPQRVYQESGVLFPAWPASQEARVIAWWEDASGLPTKDPAWTESSKGLWMSHILLADGGTAKQHMLAAMVARYYPGAWPLIAQAALENAGRIDSFSHLDDATSAIARAASPGKDGDEVRRLLAQVQKNREHMRAARERKEMGNVLDLSQALRGDLTEAYARVQHSATNEFRGVWDHDGVGWYPGDWKRSCRVLAASGINAVFPNLLWGGLAHFPSKVIPGTYSLRTYGDQAAQVVRAAHACGLKIHAWVVCWNPGDASDEFMAKMKQEGRLVQGPDGKIQPWLNPAHPSNQAMLLHAIRELAAYELDGIHLDYIRYAGSLYDCGPWTRRAFETAIGRPVARWPHDVMNDGPLSDRFRQWRADQITGFVRSVRNELKRLRPQAQLSAAVFAEYPDCVQSVGQDWGLWLREGLVDFVCPMTYTENLAKFSADTSRHQRLAAQKGRVYPGIGVSANESRLLPDQTIEQIVAARAAGARGFMLFSVSPELRDQALPMLKLGVTRPE